MNHQNSVTLEGVIVDMREKKNASGKTYISFRLKSNQVKQTNKGDITLSYQTWLQAWGKLINVINSFKVGDQIRVEGSFTTDVKELTVINPQDKKPVLRKIYSVYINVRSIDPISAVQKTESNEMALPSYDDLPF